MKKVCNYILLFLIGFCVSTLSGNAATEYTFSYTGDYQEFVVPTTGYYKLEVWGAEGGSFSTTYRGGKGGYSSGEVLLQKGQKLYIYVGGQGDVGTGVRDGGYNGGGNSSNRSGVNSTTAGGATDIRLVSGEWDNEASLLSRFIVAGGGGSGSANSTVAYGGIGGAGGGLLGINGTSTYGSQYIGGGASQTTGGTRYVCSNNQPGSFGKGGNAATAANDCPGGAGGGGWYGGGSGSTGGAGGGGGSGFVLTAESIANTPEGYSVTEEYYLENAITMDGTQAVPNYDGTGTMTGNSGNGYAKITYIKGSFIIDIIGIGDYGFDALVHEYDIYVTGDTPVNIDIDKKLDGYTYLGLGSTTFKVGDVHYVSILSPDGELEMYRYTIKEKTLNVDNITFDEVSFSFDPSIYEYDIEVSNDITKLTPNVISNGTYTVAGNNQLKVGRNTITITITNDDTSIDYVFTVNRASTEPSSTTSTTFEYTGDVQEFTAPTTGYYKLEVWGAEGGSFNTRYVGGKGGYSSGFVKLQEGQTIYIYVGGQGNVGTGVREGGYNGGGNSSNRSGVNSTTAGGATDIRLVSGEWDNEASLLSRFIVAGGGGSGSANGSVVYGGVGGAGGGPSGINGTSTYGSQYIGGGASQTTGGTRYVCSDNQPGSFGKGGNAATAANDCPGGAGGGGWYGGGSGSTGGAGGGGGSGFVLTAESIANTPENYSVTEEYYLVNAVTMDGTEDIPTHDGEGTMTGNSGDGYARITYVGEMGIEDLILSSGNLSPEFANDIYEYTLELESDVYELDVDAILGNSNDSITGLGTYSIPTEGKDITITTTNSFGVITIYTIHVERPVSIDALLDNILVNGISIDNFNSSQYSYEVEVPYYTEKVNLEAVPNNPYQELSYENSFVFDGESEVKTILVTSESGTENQLYTITFNREQTTYLKSLKLSNGQTLDFKPDTFEYNIDIFKDVYELDVEYTTYNTTAQVEVTGTGFLKDDPDPIVITVTNGSLPPSTYTIHLTRSEDVDFSQDYTYTGDYQTFIAPTSGFYKLETWGAEGGTFNTKYTGGKGGYAAGTVKLQAGQQLYIYVGGQGDVGTGVRPGGYNGGGNSSNRSGVNSTTGGGATDIRLVAGTWDDQTSLLSRFIVAGGGGSGSANGTAVYGGVGGAGGGPSGINGTSTYGSRYIGKGGTQTAGGTRTVCGNNQPGSFGKGGNAATLIDNCPGGAGGGGWYGGGSGSTGGAAGGGGSGFVLSLATANSTPEGYSVSEDFYLTETTNLAGNQTIPNYDGTGTMTGNSGNGHAKITLLETLSSLNYLDSLLVDGESVLDFEPNKMEYTVNLNTDQYKVDIAAVPKDNNAVVSGVGKTFIPAGGYEHSVLVTATDGSVRTYKINFIRGADNNTIPEDIEIKGMISSLCGMDESYCVYTFDINTTEYDITLPFSITDLEIIPDIAPTQTVEYYVDDSPVESGEITLENTTTKVEVKVIAENGMDSQSYIYNFTKDDRANSYLQSITITNPVVEFEFDKMVYEYYLEIDGSYSSYDIEAIPESPASHVMISGNENLQAGNNDCIITVTSALGTTKTYIIHMYKAEDTNTYLDSLELTDGEDNPIEFAPTFSKYLNDYSVVVESDVDEVKINATPEGANAEVEGTGTFSLNSGLNQFVITVSSESGATLDYNLAVFRNKSSNANINIEVVGYDIAFDPEVYDYVLEIPKEVTDLDIIVTPEVDTTTYTISGNTEMNKTNNIITITSTVEDGTKKTYTIEAVKQLSTNNYLQDITLSEGTLDPVFNSLTNNYRVEVSGKTDKITVTGIPEDNTTRVTGNGEYSLTKGENVITLTAISEDGEVNVYTIMVNKALDNDTTLKEIKNSQNSVASEVEHDDYDYVIDVQYEVSSIEIEGIPNSDTSVVTGNGTYRLSPGDNIITLSVQAEDGSVAYHRVNIIRDLSANDDLQFLYVEEGGLSPRFNETTVYYEVKVPNDVNILTIEAITEDPDATYEVIGNDGLEVGVPKEIIVRVKAPKGNTKDYTLMVTRQEITSNNLDLLSLETNRGELIPTFSPSTTNYTLEVANEITDITVNATAATPESVTVEGTGTYNLNVGKNAISVFVIGEDGIQKDYQMVVTRNKSSDASLSNLVISGSVLTPEFEKDTLEYQVNTDKDSLEFRTITPTQSEATYEVIGNENFVTGPNEVTIKVTAPDGVTTREYKIIANKAASQNNNLISLEVDGYTLYPTFNKGITYYEVDVNSNVNNVIINATPEDDNAEVEGTGLKTLQTGSNRFEIIVTSEAGTTKTYTVVVNKALSTNNYLSILEPNYGNFNEVFDKELTEYTLTVPYDITNISFVANPEDAEAIVTKKDSYELRVGRNDINITVMSESGDIRIYHIVVTRNEIESSLLKELEINGYELTPEFRSENFEYQVNVNSETNSLEFTSIVPLEEGATYEVTGNENFVMGINEVRIKVSSKNPEIPPTEYVLYVNKQASGSNFLEYLEVTDHELTPEFDKNILEYDVTVNSSVASVEVVAKTEDANARITEGVGNHSLQYGLNKIRVVVKSSLGITRTYIINVTRELDNNNYLQNLEVIINNQNQIEFNRDTLTYDVQAGAEDKLVEIRAEAENANAQVSGDGIFELVSGTLTKEVTVVSEAGEARIYKININKEVSTNNSVLNIIPSTGTLEPTFNSEEHEYNLVLDEIDHELSFEVTTSSTYAKVEGHELAEVPEGTSDRVIKVTAEDGTENTYTIHVIKENNSALLQELSIDGYEIEFDPNTFSYNIQVSASKDKLLESEITAIPMDDEATVNLMGDMNLSEGIINIYVIEVIAKDGYTTQEYRLNITRDSEEYTLSSDVYDIIRIDEDYVIGITQTTDLTTFKGNFNNDQEMLHVYNTDGTEEVVDVSSYAGTGLILRLEKDGYVYDQVRVIVRADLTGDGRINVTDQVRLINYVGKVGELNTYEMLAADLTGDGIVNVLDQVRIINYIGRLLTDSDLNP